jgi:hypothetical protein
VGVWTGSKWLRIGTDSLPIDMLLSAVSVLVVAQWSSEIPEGLMNNRVYLSSKKWKKGS